jgi:hypothetical protein
MTTSIAPTTIRLNAAQNQNSRSWVLKRDLNPAAKNDPMWLEKAA